jgi:hypothetical protein
VLHYSAGVKEVNMEKEAKIGKTETERGLSVVRFLVSVVERSEELFWI